jgi:methionyl-tRNA formyltransferase
MSNRLRIVFMGTPEFAVASLDALFHSQHEVVGVVTVADKQAGRGLQISMSAVKQYAVEKSIPVLQPLKLKDSEFIAELNDLNADLFVVVAFRMLPEIVWNMPPKGTINLHGSLLPNYRGAAPINWAVINGEKETGVTTFFLQHEIDTGKVIRRTIIPIGENESAGELHDRMMVIGAKTLAETVDAIADGSAEAVAQDMMIAQGERVNHAPKIFKDDCKIDWSKSVDEVHNFIRGLSPYPAAWTTLQEKSLKIFSGEKEYDNQNHSGEVDSDGKTYIRFGCNNGWYRVGHIQLEGKKRMHISEFIIGFRPSK